MGSKTGGNKVVAMNWFTIAIVCILLSHVHGYAHYRFQIPNGDKVPHPCNPNLIWEGVGHFSRGGGGQRNPFGLDFAANNFVWDRTLCEKDSDEDGKTNGQELGDPECTWIPNAIPYKVIGLSHPGVCEPLTSDKCKGQSNFVNCTTAEFSCDAISEEGVFNFAIRLPETRVPARETTYQCMPVEFPTDADYHMVAMTPHIDNINVMHHAILYGCREEVIFTDTEPYDCFMGSRRGCNEFIALWALGFDGYCFHPKAGIKIGQSGYKRAVLELHWNNPENIDSYTDASGLNVFLTQTLREFNAGVLMIGDTDLEIPPSEHKHTVHGSCSSKCTSQYMSGPINIFTATNHMHYLGTGAESKLIHKDSKLVDDLAIDTEYSYDRPLLHSYDQVVLMNPGDELHVSCHFRSMTKSKTTFYGEETSDEMCYTFLFYYPAESMSTHQCVSHGIYQGCENRYGLINGCNFFKAFDQSDPKMVARVLTIHANCALHTCLKECKMAIKAIMSEDPCYQPVNKRYLIQVSLYSNAKAEVLEYWGKIRSCDAEIEAEMCTMGNEGNGETSKASRQTAVYSEGIILLVVALCYLMQ